MLFRSLIGLESVLAFNAWGVDVILNRAADSDANPLTNPGKLDWSALSHGTTYTGLDIDTTLASLNGTALGSVTASVDLKLKGSAILNAGNGALVARGDFTLAIGQVRAAALVSGAGQDADALALTLSNVAVFVGTGGSINTNGTANLFSDDTVVNGTLGFGATLNGLTVVSIKDRGANASLDRKSTRLNSSH